jgi:PAS domain S-box-containing protein
MATILVVDDLPVNRKVLVELLAHEGHRLLQAADGRQGLAAAQAEHPDLVITDVLMPVMDGYELVKQLRLDPATSAIPVMFYTAHYGEREARGLALSSGVSYVLTKPIEPEQVLESVGRALSGLSNGSASPEAVLRSPEFDHEHLRLLTDKLSEKAGDLRAANARLRAVINIGLELASERESDRLLQSVCIAARDLFGATYVTIGILALNDRTVERVVTSGMNAASWILAGEPLSGLLATVVSERRTFRGASPDGDPAARRSLVQDPEVRTYLAVPVASPTHVYGWLCLVGTDGKAFTEDDEALTTALAGQVGRIYENGHLYDVARKRAEELEREVCERKQAEQALNQTGRLQRAIFNNANFSCIATDATGLIQIFNVGAERMLGYTAAEAMNTIRVTDLHDPQALVVRAAALSLEFGTSIAPGFEALVFKAARGIEDIYELTKICKDGSRLPAVVSITALRDAQDAIIGYLLIGTDNTARKEAEDERMKLDQRLRDQQFYTRSLIESNIDALMTTDPRGIITDVNRQMEALTGCRRDELIGAPFKNYFTDPARAEAAINQVLNEQKVTNYELTAQARDGQETVVSYNATTFYDRDRKLQGVFAAARDVTELKRFEQALQEKNIALEGASRMKSEFLANMSHELRTPLNSIIGFSEVLRDGLLGELTDQQRGFIGDIFSSGQHLLSLINDILDLSKVEAGKMMLDLEPVQVPSLLANSLSIVRERAVAHRIRMEMDVPEALGSIRADARKVKQIVYNLLSNAVKFTADGGRVTLRASRVPRAEVGQLSGPWVGRSLPLGDSAFAEFLKITVTDSGIGIADDGFERLFKPFSQVDSGLARKFEGTGLGLAMVKLLAELHGGAVAVESAVGAGTCFTVCLPLRSAEEAAALAPADTPCSPAIAAPPGSRIALVVEDDYKSAQLIRLHLEGEGFTVLHAVSAEAALVIAVQQPVSLITLDILLPKMEGWEFLSRLKQIPDLRRTPVVIISIVADHDKGIALGAAAVIQKPISRQELYESLFDVGLFPRSRGRTLNVLVVDDDPKGVELIAVRIRDLGGTVLRASGGREAIDKARRERPDVMVLDLMMPDVTGFDVVKALQENPDTACIPIVVVTAKQITAEDRTKLTGYVTTIMEKTDFDAQRFTAEVRRAMSGRAMSGRRAVA